MLLDSQNLFSDNQKITKTTDSTNIVRFGAGDISYVPLLVQVVRDFTTCESLTVQIKTSNNPSFENAVTLISSTMPLTELKAGKKFPICHMPKGNLGYVKLSYTVNGSDETTGAITAGVIAKLDTELDEVGSTDPITTTPEPDPTTTTPEPTPTPPILDDIEEPSDPTDGEGKDPSSSGGTTGVPDLDIGIDKNPKS